MWLLVQCRSPDSKVHGPTWGPSGADRTQVSPMLAPWTLLSGSIQGWFTKFKTGYYIVFVGCKYSSWWRHQKKTFSILLALCAGKSLVTSEFPSQRPVTRSFDVFFDLRLNKRLSKQPWGWWFVVMHEYLHPTKTMRYNIHALFHFELC